jgi:hypothetical protein
MLENDLIETINSFKTCLDRMAKDRGKERNTVTYLDNGTCIISGNPYERPGEEEF